MVLDPETEREFKEALIERTKMLRERKGWSQSEMAQHLGTSLAKYKKYETRSPLPHHLIPRFCALIGVSLEFFLMGMPGAPADRRLRPRKH